MNAVCRSALVAAALWAAVYAAPAGDAWKPVSSEHGVEIYRRTVPGSDVVALKGVGVVDAPVWKIASILLDTKRAPEWADSLKESRVLRRIGPTEYVEYNHIGLPLIIKDRDFVSEVQIEVDPAARTFALVYRPSGDGLASPTHNVRGEILAGRFEAVSLERGARTRLSAELQADPKGLLPTWIVNMFQRNWPLTTFERLRLQAAKPDIAMPPDFRDVLSQTLGF
ncbi:MAG TPA: START domain-containing protein [Vicinamibacterales bacterium]|nr:START domain-containing protein [Vicinamibacterales bacterium]